MVSCEESRQCTICKAVAVEVCSDGERVLACNHEVGSSGTHITAAIVNITVKTTDNDKHLQSVSRFQRA